MGGIRPSSEDSTSRSGVRIFNVVEEGRVEYLPVRAPSASVPGPSDLRVSSGRFRKRRSVEALWKDASKFQVPLQDLSNIVLLRIWVLVPLWTVSNLARSRGEVRENGEPLLCSRVDCHNWCFVFDIWKLLSTLLLLLFSSSALWNCFSVLLIV